MTPQLTCCDSRQTWMRYPKGNNCIDYFEKKLGKLIGKMESRVTSREGGVSNLRQPFAQQFVQAGIKGNIEILHDGVIKWKHFPRYWPFVRGIHRSPVNSPYKGQWHGALVFSLIFAWINDWVNNREAGDLRRHRVRYYVTVMALLALCEGNHR